MPGRNTVFQFKVQLEEITPAIWRRIQVPRDYSFWDLHVAIQDSMGWFDCHLHVFRQPYNGFVHLDEIGIPDEDRAVDDPETLPGWKVKISRHFKKPGDFMEYEYDFGDTWVHEVVLEKILPAEVDVQYPCCVAGERACPPEDCGGVRGYCRTIAILKDSKHKEHKEMFRWLNEGWYKDYDPDVFVPEKVKFMDSKKRLKMLFEGPGGI